MESTFVFDSRITPSVLLPSNKPMTSTLEKKCFLCNVKEIDGNCLVDSQETSLILCKVLNVPHLMNELKKPENINYCHPCKERILKIRESLEILKKLENEILEDKYLIELQLETNYKVIGNESQYSSMAFGVELVNEMKLKSIKSKLKQVIKNQIDQKFCLKTKNYRIMNNITITEKLRRGTFEGHISKDSTPQIYTIISTETKPFISDSLSLPSSGNFVHSATNSPFNHAESPLTPHVYEFDEIKLEMLGGDTNNPVDLKDPFEGIVPESGLTENSSTQKTFICGTCETNFDDYNQLDEHCCTNIGSRFSPNEFISKLSLNTDSYIHVNNLLECRYCAEVFPDQFVLKLHERIHAEKKSFKCSYCEKSFSQPHCVKTHMRIHTGEKPYKCGYCEKTFGVRSNKNTHERIHKEKKPFKCEYCDKTFRHRNHMEIHERSHASVKPFECKFCDKSFSRRYSMNVHERIHTNEDPFKCGYCGKTFRCCSNMRKHERIHTGEKPIKCKYCDKTFRDRSHIKRHESIHAAVKNLNEQIL